MQGRDVHNMQFKHADMSRVCKACGHPVGEHSSTTVGGKKTCFLCEQNPIPGVNPDHKVVSVKPKTDSLENPFACLCHFDGLMYERKDASYRNVDSAVAPCLQLVLKAIPGVDQRKATASIKSALRAIARDNRDMPGAPISEENVKDVAQDVIQEFS